MRLVRLTPPFHSLRCRVAGPAGSSVEKELPFQVATMDALPPGLAGLVCTSDLQGEAAAGEAVLSPGWQGPLAHTLLAPSHDALCPGATPMLRARMLREVVAEELFLLGEIEQIPRARDLGVLLAGDFYAAPGAVERGGQGDIRPVFQAFQERFRFVVGVLGNHDLTGPQPEGSTEISGMLLDGNTCQREGLRLAGISGIIGRATKPSRRSETDYLALAARLAVPQPDLFILHEAPQGSEPDQVGSAPLRAIIQAGPPGLVICGHKHWPSALSELPNGTQILNVNFRVVILLSDRGS